MKRALLLSIALCVVTFNIRCGTMTSRPAVGLTGPAVSNVPKTVPIAEDGSAEPATEGYIPPPGLSASASLTQMPQSYRQGLEFLANRKYAEALAVFDAFLADHSPSRYSQATELNVGRALEGLERYSDATARYRSVILATHGLAPRLEAMALYRTSFCHEALGEDQMTVAVLYDLFNRVESNPGLLPDEVSRAEVPARLAGAYARIGNYNRALSYYKKAEGGIARLKRVRTKSGTIPLWLPRTLFFMGRVAAHSVSWNEFESALRPLAYGQIYLLQASDLGIEPWADQAATELMQQYGQLINVIQSPPLTENQADPVIESRAVQKKQWERAEMLVENLQELVARQAPLPKAEQKPSSQKIFAFVDDAYARINAILASRPAGEGLTADSEARTHGLRGRVISPDNVLEREFNDKPHPPVALPPSKKPGDAADPNL